MSIRALSLRSFRKFSTLDLSFCGGITVITGQNGVGKTSILEAIAILGSGKSFRQSRTADFIRMGEEFSTISASVEHQGLDSNVKINIHPNGKKVFIDNKLAKSTKSLFDLIPSIVFSPSDHRIIEGDSTERKAFLNRAAFTIDWSYIEVLTAYNKCLLQRNKVLKEALKHDLSESQLIDHLSVWDEQMIQHGTELIFKRKTYLDLLAPHIQDEYRKISQTGDSFSAAYEPFGVDGLFINYENLEDYFRNELKDSLRRDRFSGSSQIGPHKDEILLTLNGNKVKFYSSQGEKRTCALALRLGELALFRAHQQKVPVLLFDDVSSELDKTRRQSLVALLKQENAQALITATEMPTALIEEANRDFVHLDLSAFGD